MKAIRHRWKYSAGYSALADAIVLQAVQDWRLARKKSGDAAKRRVAECEGFFRDKWFEALTDMDGECFLRLLREKEAADR